MGIKRKLTAFVSVVISLCLLTACNNRNNETEKRQAEIAEYNVLTEETRTAVDLAKEMSEKFADELMGLYLFNRTADTLTEVFYTYEDTEPVDDEGERTNKVSFYEEIINKMPVDTYDSYLRSFALQHNIAVADIEQAVKDWNNLEDDEKIMLLGTEQDCSAFALYNATVTYHDYFTRLGTDVVTEIYCFTGEYAEQLSVVVLWQNGKIMDVTRMYSMK